MILLDTRRLFCSSFAYPISPQQFNYVYLKCWIIVFSIPINYIFFCCCWQFFAYPIRYIVNINYFSLVVIPAILCLGYCTWTNEDLLRGKALALIRARRNVDFAMLPIVSEMFLPSWDSKMLFQNIWYWMIYWGKIIFMDIIYVELQQ